MPDLSKLFDSYNRVARLYPALLVSAPIVWTLGAFHPELVSGNGSNIILTAIVFFGGLYLLSNLARSAGKSLEDKLNRSWDGWRTTALLRHRDLTIDRFTKTRYHSALQTLCGNTFYLPTQDEEITDSIEADQKYRSATKLLIEKRRDKKHDLLHKELAAYGFRRNLLGLKPVGILIVMVALLINIVEWHYTAPVSIGTIDSLAMDAMQRWIIYTLFLANIGYLAILLAFINSRFVLHSANEYAIALFRTLENPM